VFLGRAVKAPQVRRVYRASKSKLVNVIHVRHRDEVEEPIRLASGSVPVVGWPGDIGGQAATKAQQKATARKASTASKSKWEFESEGCMISSAKAES
jgi:hypothetical protein